MWPKNRRYGPMRRPREKTTCEVVTSRVTPYYSRRIKQIAKEQRRTRTEVIREILQGYIDALDRRRASESEQVVAEAVGTGPGGRAA